MEQDCRPKPAAIQIPASANPNLKYDFKALPSLRLRVKIRPYGNVFGKKIQEKESAARKRQHCGSPAVPDIFFGLSSGRVPRRKQLGPVKALLRKGYLHQVAGNAFFRPELSFPWKRELNAFRIPAPCLRHAGTSFAGVTAQWSFPHPDRSLQRLDAGFSRIDRKKHFQTL